MPSMFQLMVVVLRDRNEPLVSVPVKVPGLARAPVRAFARVDTA